MSYDSTYMWNLKKDTNEPIYKTEGDSQALKKQTSGYLRVGRDDLEEEGEGRGKKGKSELDFPSTCFICLFFAFSGRVYIK